MDLQQFVTAMRVRWKFSVVTFLLGIAATAAILITATPMYGSTVKVFISTPTGGQAEYAASFIVTSRVASYADLATDPALLQNVVDRLDLDSSAEDLADRITASVVTGTQTIEISVEADSPELARDIADAEAQEVVRLVTRIEEPTVSGQQPAIAARVTGDASFSESTVAPNLVINGGVGLLLSLFLAIAGAVLRDLLDRTVKSRDEIEAITGGGVLASLPFDPQVKSEPLSSELGSPLSESLRVLRTNLQYANVDAKNQAILVSSAVPNEGKTLVATNLAIAVAQSGRSVLLIDADMRNPNVAELLGLENAVGVLTVLIGRTTLQNSIQSHPSGIDFLGTGPMPPNPSEVLDSRAMKDLVRSVRDTYDTVIIDAPPMLPVADASILVTEVDGALLLVRHGSTTREQVRLAVARIQGVGGHLFGAVLNRTPRSSAESYGYGYGYGYGTTATSPPSKRIGGVRGRRAARG